MAITYSDPDVDADEHTVQIAALSPTDNAVIIGNGTAWTAESGATLRASLGLAIGSDVMAYDADLNDWAGVSPSNYLTTAAAAAAYQPLTTNGTTWAAVTRASGFDTFVATPSSANLRSLITDEAGSGSLYFTGGALGTPASGTLSSCTGLPVSTGISGLATGIATFLATPSSANLISAITDETGSGALVFATSPTLVTPTLGVATATSINKVALTAPATSATLTIANGKTLTASNTLTFTGTDGSTLNVGAGGTLGTAAYVADNTLVHLAGTETVSGKKSFSGGIAITGDGGSGAGTISTGSNYGIVITSGQSSPGIAQFAVLNSAQSATLMYLQSNVLYVNSDPVMTRGATETVAGPKTFSSTLNLTANPASSFQIDFTNAATVTIANAANDAIGTTSFSGVIILHDASDGQIGLYIVGAGVTYKIGGAAKYVSSSTPASGEVGVQYDGVNRYRVYNNQGSSRTLYVSLMRTRPAV